MSALLDVILPVFLVLGAGYLAAWRGWMTEGAVDGLMRFAQNFAVPVLLCQQVARMDLGAGFDPGLLGAFYAGAFASYAAGWWGARRLFGRGPEDAVAVGFVCMFSNSLLIGVPITERAYGPQALPTTIAIISVHAPLLYTFGITVMEATRARSLRLPLGQIVLRALRGVVTTPLVIGIMIGFALNVAGRADLTLPASVWAAIDMLGRAGLPAALFGLGGVLHRYRPEGDAATIAWCCACALVLHPAVAWALGRLFGLDLPAFRSAVLTAAMPPGVNAYLFASIYRSAQRVAASTVLVSTALSMLTLWLWLTVLP